MKPIEFPLHPQDRGEKVVDLQDALLLLINNQRIQLPAGSDLVVSLRLERGDQVYKNGTAQAVKRFREQFHLAAGETVDESTAMALNEELKKLRAFDESLTLKPGFDLLSLGMTGAPVAEAQKALVRLGYSIPQHELAEAVFGAGTQSAVQRFQEATNLTVTGLLDERTTAELRRTLASQGGAGWLMEGRVVYEDGEAAIGLTLRFRHSGFCVEPALLIPGEIKTDDDGRFSMSYMPAVQPVILSVHALKGDGTEVTLSERKTADRWEVLRKLVAPSELKPADAAEFNRLTDALRPLLGARRLAEAREDDERGDLTLLHASTGWDARVIALAAHADRLATEPEIADSGLGGDKLYGLLRAGLPADAGQLALETEESVEAALKKAAEAGIVQMADGEIVRAKAAFTTFAQAKRLTGKAPGAFSTTGEMLAAAGLNATEQGLFTRAYTNHLRTGADLWDEARREGLPDAQINKLKVQGKLAFLTHNHVPLVEALTGRVDLMPDDLSGLVDKDFYEPATWQKLFIELAGGDSEEQLNVLAPPAYEGDTAAASVAAASEDYARKVRISYPTQVARRIVEKDTTNHLGLQLAGQRTSLPQTLRNAQSLRGGFELGRESVDAFINRNKETLFPGHSEAEIEATRKSLRTLQRVYQITPSATAMTSLLSLGFKSARDVTKLSKSDFLRTYAHRFSSPMEAELTYDKATQVSTVTFNFFSMAQQLQNSVPTGATARLDADGAAPTADTEKDSVLKNLIKQYPTLESLLGSQDYGECENCQSVLSPSAYFVDLLEFLNPDDKPVWENFLAEWKHTHADEDYGRPKPFDVLMQRRPDLEHLPLTCENTETVLPYIDVVNEILEYSVVHGQLDKGAAHDTGHVSSEELLAEPQNVLPEAYQRLKEARYPLTLPFDLWLETVRRFFAHNEASLAEALEAVCKTDKLYESTVAYDRMAVAMEAFGLSQTEVGLFTEPEKLKEWFTFYGYETEADALKVLAPVELGKPAPNAKRLSQRLGITYKELVALVKAEFVNPGLKAAAFLHRLGLDFSDLRRLERTPTDALDQAAKDREEAELNARIEKIAEELNLLPADVKQQVQDARDALDLSKVLVLSDTETRASFDQTTLQFGDGASPVSVNVLLKINLFVRLWRKLGWSMEETDRALGVFAGDSATLPDLDALGAAMRTVLLYLERMERLLVLLPLRTQARHTLLTFWSNLSTAGPSSLYSRLFLNRAVLRNDPVFDHPLGQYLSGDADLKAHLVAVQGAVGLSVEDIGRIVADAHGQPPLAAEVELDREKLNLGVVSLLWRHALLAKALKLTVSELLSLKQLSGLDPFTPLKTRGDVKELTDDALCSQTLQFVELAGRLRERRVKIEALDYLFRHRRETDTVETPPAEAVRPLMQELATALRQVTEQHLLPDAVDEAWLLPKLSVVLPSDLAGELLTFTAGSVEHEASTADNTVPPADQIPPATLANESGLKLSYSTVRQRQQLTWRGYLSESKRNMLAAAKSLGVNAASNLRKLLDDVRTNAAQRLASTVERALSLAQAGREYHVTRPEADPNEQIPAADFAHEPRLRVWHDGRAGVQHLAWRGPLTEDQAKELRTHSPARTLRPLLDDVRQRVREEGEALAQASIDVTIDRAEMLAEKPLAAINDKIKNLLETTRDQPRFRLSYDAEVKTLRLSYTGICSAAARKRLMETLSDPPTELDPLLDAVQQEAKAAIEHLRDQFSELFGGQPAQVVLADDAPRNLAQAWLPFIKARVTREAIEAVLTSELGGDGSLTAMLIGDARSLHLLEHTGIALREIFEEAGVLPDLPSLDGYLQVPTSGAYRFSIAGLAKSDVGSIEIGTPAAIILEKKAGLELVESGAMELQAGEFIRCVVKVSSAKPDGVRVLIQGEALPLGSLDRLSLYSAAAIERIAKARLLLSKALQMVQSCGLAASELRHALDRPANFASLSLSTLPLLANNPAAAPAPALLAQWEALIVLVKLKEELETDGDSVLAILEAVTGDDAWTRIGTLAECSAAKVQEVAAHLAVRLPLDAKSLLRLWRALRMVGRVGGPDEKSIGGKIAEVLRWIVPDPGPLIARDVRNALKARVPLENWAQVAQPIFDLLRKLQRDALVAYLVHREGLESADGLYEIFLIDPGSEPVLQTSRMALAVSALQIFIQRVFLNQEKQVHPSALDAKQWQWLKRSSLRGAAVRTWLWPENLMDLALRDDETHLFQELKSKLLQGNVNGDRAEEAFYGYVRGLAEIAKMELLTMYCEQHPNPARNVVHLFGRVPNDAQKFFYRRCAHGMWTPWEPVSVSIESDHITCIIWRGRLQLFWLTFLPAEGQGEEAKGCTPREAADKKSSSMVQNRIKVQLNWSEYFQGKWTARKFGKEDGALEFKVLPNFKKSHLFIHASKDTDGKGGDGALWVNLRDTFGPHVVGLGFKLVSKLVPPIATNGSAPELPLSPYGTAFGQHPTKQAGLNALRVKFKDTIVITSGTEAPGEGTPHKIIDSPTDFKLLTCTHPAPLPNAEIAALTAPFFYEDEENTFFVEPTLVEQTVSQWSSWGVPPSAGLGGSAGIGVLNEKALVSIKPHLKAVPDLDPLSPISLRKVLKASDWVTNPATEVKFDGRTIGRTGGVKLTTIVTERLL